MENFIIYLWIKIDFSSFNLPPILPILYDVLLLIYLKQKYQYHLQTDTVSTSIHHFRHRFSDNLLCQFFDNKFWGTRHDEIDFLLLHLVKQIAWCTNDDCIRVTLFIFNKNVQIIDVWIFYFMWECNSFNFDIYYFGYYLYLPLKFETMLFIFRRIKIATIWPRSPFIPGRTSIRV